MEAKALTLSGLTKELCHGGKGLDIFFEVSTKTFIPKELARVDSKTALEGVELESPTSQSICSTLRSHL